MDWLSQIEWGTFAALVTAAATLATAVSTSVVLVLRHRDRAEPDWAVLTDGDGPDRHSTSLVLSGKLTNAGDGAAFRVIVRGDRCETGLRTEPGKLGITGVVAFIPLMAPGDEARLAVSCDPAENWDRANLVIEWTRSPTRRRKRMTHRMPLREIAPTPDEREQRSG